MITQVIVIVITVFGRYDLTNPGWGEPVALLAWSGSAFLATLVVRDNRHLSVTADYILSAGAIKYFNILNDIIISLLRCL